MLSALLAANLAAIALPLPLADALEWDSAPQPVRYVLDFAAGEHRVRARIDSSGTGDPAISLESPADAQQVQRVVSELRKELSDETSGHIWCDQYGRLLPDLLTVDSSSPGRIRYRFRPRSAHASDADERRMLEASTALLTIARSESSGRWSVAEFQLSLAHSFHPTLFARIDSLELRIECEAADTTAGRTYQRHVRTTVSGAAMGMAFSETQSVEISDLTLGPKAADAHGLAR